MTERRQYSILRKNMSNEIVDITYSEMAALDMCPKKWWFGYNQLLVPKKPRRALDIGTATHDAVEAYYEYVNSGEPWNIDDLIKSTLEAYDKSIEEFIAKGGYPPTEEQVEEDKALVESMIRQYIAYATVNDDFEMHATEEQFDIPIINPYTGEVHENLRLRGKVDGWAIIRDHNFIVEHKTSANPARDFWWPYLNQIDTYTYAMQRKHGVEFTGAILNVMVKKLPSKPKLLKSGKAISKTLGDTTVDIFKSSIEEFGLDVNDYQDKIDEIERKGNLFVRREHIYRRAKDLEEIEKKIWHAINRKMTITFHAKNRTDKCNYMCSFKDICIDDNELLREELYYTKDRAHSELENVVNASS